MKKLLSILLTLALACSLAVPVLAAEQPEPAGSDYAAEAYEGDESSDYDRGWNDGYDAGRDAGYDKGMADFAAGKPLAEFEYPEEGRWEEGTYQEGYDTGYALGLYNGYLEGYMKTYHDGYDAAFDAAWDRGYAAGEADGKAGTPSDPWDSVGKFGAEEDYSYECGLNDGSIVGYTDGYAEGYSEVTGRSYNEDLAIYEKGGVPGRINVMWNGEMIDFPDRQPEIKNGRTMVPVRAVMEGMGAQVDYDASTKTVAITLNGAATVFTVGSSAYSVTRDGQTVKGTMDCACYNQGGRVMVPVRFLAEASGCTVLWDKEHKTVVIVDARSLAEKIDESFTCINSVLAARLAENQGKNQESTSSFTAKNTLYDEEKGAITFPISGRMTSYTDGTAWRIEFSLSIKDALQTMIENDMGFLADATVSLRTAMRADLTNLTATLILDKEGNLYFQAPVLLELLSGQPMKDNQWISLGNVGEFGMDMNALTGGSMTIGSLLTSMLLQDENAFYLDEALETAVPLLEAIYGDSNTQKNGDSYTWNIDLATILLTAGLAELTAEDLGDNNLTATLTADVKGNYSLTGDWRLGGEDAAFTGSLNTSGTADSGKLTLTLSLTDLFDLELSSESTTRTVRSLPSLALPEGAEVLDDEALLDMT